MIKFEEYQEKLNESACIEIKNRDEFNKYRDIIMSKTNEGFRLLTNKEYKEYIEKHLTGVEVWGEQYINEPADIAKCRKLVESLIQDQYTKNLRRLQLILSEGATNIIKHAYNGKLTIIKSTDCIRLVFCDRGPGISCSKLFYYIFHGSSIPENSLGVGFGIMYLLSEKIYLYVTDYGTTLIIEFLEES